MLKQTRVAQLILKRWPEDTDPIVITPGRAPDAQHCTAAIATVIRLFLEGAVKDEAWFLAQLNVEAEVPVDSTRLGSGLFMDVSRVKQLIAAGMAIGSHGQRHQSLAGLEECVQRHELGGSKQFLQSVLGLEVHALAYPFGWAGSFTEPHNAACQ